MDHHIYLLMRKTICFLVIVVKCFYLLTEIGTAFQAAYKPLLIYPNIPASFHAVRSRYPKIAFGLVCSYMTMPFRERHQREMKQGWCFRNRV